MIDRHADRRAIPTQDSDRSRAYLLLCPDGLHSNRRARQLKVYRFLAQFAEGNDILDIWADIPEERRDQARDVLRTFRRKSDLG